LKRTFGAAVGAVLFILFSSHLALRLTPKVADAALAAVLEVPEGAPLLHIDQTDRDARGRPVMLSAEWHVADAFALVVNRRAERFR